jgi:hypothetical protein
MSLVFSMITECSKMLSNLDGWLKKAEAHAKAKGYDANVLLAQRLAPDQYPLVRQVQSSCDGAKFLAARLAAKDPPKHPDTETTMEELHARIAAVTAYLATYTEKDFEGADTRTVKLGWMEGKGLRGGDNLVQLALPNFFFHVVTAYAILRHNGVELGKIDYLGSLPIIDV